MISNERYVTFRLLIILLNKGHEADGQIMQLVDQSGRQGLRWTAAIRALEQQSSIPIDHAEFAEVVKGLTDEGVIKIIGEREKRTIRRLAD